MENQDETLKMTKIILKCKRIKDKLNLRNELQQELSIEFQELLDLLDDPNSEEIYKLLENNFPDEDFRPYIKIPKNIDFSNYSIKCHLNKFRKSKGMNVQDFVDYLGITRAEWYRMIRGDNINLKLAATVAEKLDCNIQDIWEYS